MFDELGMFVDMPAEEYHSNPNVVGHSALVSLLQSPKRYRASLLTGRTVTEAMEFGTAFHTRVLEPELFEKTYVVKPKFDRRKSADKEAEAAWDAQNEGKKTITESGLSDLNGMFESIMEEPHIEVMVNNSYREKSFFWTDEETGIECRIRPDLLVYDAQTKKIIAVADLKSTQNASKERFKKEISDRGYDLQAAFYADAVSGILGRAIPFFLIPVESVSPFCAASYEVGSLTMEVGRKKYRTALQLLQWCRANNRWPGYQLGQSDVIEIPNWAAQAVLNDV